MSAPAEAAALAARPPLEDIKTEHGLRRLHYVDGLRAFAALWVILFHGWQAGNPLATVPVVGFFFRFITQGQLPVLIFLVLSGFCLYYPLVLKNPDAPVLKTGYGAFVLRRARRILPPFYAALVLCLLGIAAWPLLGRAAPGDLWHLALPATPWAVLTHVLMIHNLFPDAWQRIDYPAWTIGLEWQLYLFFPLLVRLFRTRGPAFTLTLAFLITLAVRVLTRKLAGPVGFALDWSPLNYGLIFASGMYAARVTVCGLPPRVPRWALSATALLSFGFVFGRGLSGTGLETGAFLLIPLGTVCLLLLAADPRSLVHRFFGTPWLVTTGVFSYSIYLLHAPLLHVFLTLLAPAPLSPFWRYAVVCFAITPAIVGLSYLFFLVCERPFIGAPRKKAARSS